MLNSSRLGAQRDPLTATPASVGRSSDRRARILDALIATVAYRGYDRTTIERVLQMADVPAAVFEEHFDDKEGCFLEALDGMLARIEERVRERVECDAAWPERVRAGLDALLSALTEDPDGARVLLVECLSAGVAADERQRALVRIFPPLLEEGRFHSANPDHLPAGTSEALVGGIASILHRRALEDRTGELPRLLGDLAYFALLPYLGHHRALVAAYARPIARTA
ncbi:MAG TPA: TetR/AcrR family transcriptional regulator [Solirubrobacteraceae bacterium]|jgi:AcrR family transcriptional regulator|nr:TetR/AcrR family transcriptional regulator [Solirubrobacteraceae bacterium]